MSLAHPFLKGKDISPLDEAELIDNKKDCQLPSETHLFFLPSPHPSLIKKNHK